MVEQVEQYEGLVEHIVSKYNFYQDYEDLYQAGMMGLIKAVQKYDVQREGNFMDYAYFYIKGEVLRSLNANHTVKISTDTYKLQQEIKKTEQDLLQGLGREPTSSEIAYILGEEVTKIEQVRQWQPTSYSLEQAQADEELTLYDKIAKIEKGHDAGVLDLKTAVAGLEASEKVLIQSRYYEDKTQSEIASALGMSQVQVSRQEQKILRKLRTTLES